MDVQKQTEMVLAWELYEQGVSKSAIARHLDHSRETIIAWIKGIEMYGLKSYIPKNTSVVAQPRPTC